MVGITELQRLPQRLRQTAHLRIARPEPFRQRPVCREGVPFSIVGHLVPIQAPDILAPAQHLPDEALSRRQGTMTAPIGRLHLLTHCQWLQ